MTNGNLTSSAHVEWNSTDFQDETLSSLIFFTIVYVLVLLTGLVGNFIVLFVILKNNDLKHFTNYFFANLSAADVFVLIFCIPTAIHDIWAQDQWYMGKFFCKSERERVKLAYPRRPSRRSEQSVHRELRDERLIIDHHGH